MYWDNKKDLKMFFVSIRNTYNSSDNWYFHYARNYNDKNVHLSMKKRIRVLQLLVDYWFLWRYKQIHRQTANYTKKIFSYHMTKKMYKICYELVVKKVNEYRFIELSVKTSLNEMKEFIKRMYPQTDFEIVEGYNTKRHFFRLKWRVFALFQTKAWLCISERLWFNRNMIYSIFEFNNLVMKNGNNI